MRTLTTLIFVIGIVLGSTPTLADVTLPKNVYDPHTKENEPITQYTFEELDALMWDAPAFLRLNDGRRVCAYMERTFGKVSDRCYALPQPSMEIRKTMTWRHATHAVEARITLTILPPPTTGMIVVDPIYPPYPGYS